jgi:hypothetical protein
MLIEKFNEFNLKIHGVVKEFSLRPVYSPRTLLGAGRSGQGAASIIGRNSRLANSSFSGSAGKRQ